MLQKILYTPVLRRIINVCCKILLQKLFKTFSFIAIIAEYITNLSYSSLPSGKLEGKLINPNRSVAKLNIVGVQINMVWCETFSNKEIRQTLLEIWVRVLRNEDYVDFPLAPYIIQRWVTLNHIWLTHLYGEQIQLWKISILCTAIFVVLSINIRTFSRV